MSSVIAPRVPWLAVLAVALIPVAATAQQAQPGAPAGSDIAWVQSPATVDLGSEAQIALEDGYAFANAADTRKLMEAMGNVVDNTEVGLVSPRAEGEDWIMVFDYNDVGYVKDDDKDKIDADALLASIKEGTEQANEIRKQRGIPGLHVVGWSEKPNYDPVSHNLQWAILARNDDGSEVVNYNVRMLGRGGYMSVTLVEDPAKLAISKPKMQRVLDGFKYNQGKTYAEWRQGDKIAQYGLAALVAGGAGAAAAKLGLFAVLGKLLAKGGKAIILVVIAFFAGLKKLFDKLRGRSAEQSYE
jgi:uncharacterized membrane-anchored protein